MVIPWNPEPRKKPAPKKEPIDHLIPPKEQEYVKFDIPVAEGTDVYALASESTRRLLLSRLVNTVVEQSREILLDDDKTAEERLREVHALLEKAAPGYLRYGGKHDPGWTPGGEE